MSYSVSYYLREGIVFIPLAVVGFIIIFHSVRRLKKDVNKQEKEK